MTTPKKKKTPASIKIEIRPTDFSFLCCVVCNGFHCEYELVSYVSEGIVGESQYGIHKNCIKHLKGK